MLSYCWESGGDQSEHIRHEKMGKGKDPLNSFSYSSIRQWNSTCAKLTASPYTLNPQFEVVLCPFQTSLQFHMWMRFSTHILDCPGRRIWPKAADFVLDVCLDQVIPTCRPLILKDVEGSWRNVNQQVTQEEIQKCSKNRSDSLAQIKLYSWRANITCSLHYCLMIDTLTVMLGYFQ